MPPELAPPSVAWGALPPTVIAELPPIAGVVLPPELTAELPPVACVVLPLLQPQARSDVTDNAQILDEDFIVPGFVRYPRTGR